MSASTVIVLVLYCLLDGFELSQGSTTFTCYGCAYQLNEIKLGFECATEPWNVTTANTVACTATSYCITKTVYNSDYTEIKSVFRTCGQPATFQCGKECCQASLYDYTCQSLCQSTFCNGDDVTPSPASPGGPADVAEIHKPFLLHLTLVFILTRCL